MTATLATEKSEDRKFSSGAARKSGPALEAMFRFIVWLIPTLDKFPRSQRFLLGDRIQNTALEVLELLIDATYSRARERALGDANLGLEKLRYLFRLCAELRYLDTRRYEFAARALDEIGRMVGGWIKANRAAQA